MLWGQRNFGCKFRYLLATKVGILVPFLGSGQRKLTTLCECTVNLKKKMETGENCQPCQDNKKTDQLNITVQLKGFFYVYLEQKP